MFSMRIDPRGGGENGDPRQVSVFDTQKKASNNR